MKIKFTDTRIEKLLAPAKGQKAYSDTEVKRLILLVGAGGTKSWFFKYRVRGTDKDVKAKLGDFSMFGMNTAAARAKAAELKHMADEGIDPRAGQSDVEKRVAAPTVAELAEEWLDVFAPGKTSEGAIRGYIMNDVVGDKFRRVAPYIGDRKIVDITSADIYDLIQHKAGQGISKSAKDVLLYAKKMFSYAANKRMIERSPASEIAPKDIIVPGRKNPLASKANDRTLSIEELRSLWSPDNGLGKQVRLALQLAVVTGQRTAEVVAMHEDDIEGRIWTNAGANRKNGKDHYVWLTDLALELIAKAREERDRLAARRVNAGRHVFQSATGKAMRQDTLSQAVKRATQCGALVNKPRKGDGELWKPHATRRTAGTLIEAKALDDFATAHRVLGHDKKGLQKTYNGYQYNDEIREALEALSAEVISLTAGDNVVAFTA